MDTLQLEQYAFDLLNQLADDFNIFDDGSFTRAIWEANTAEKMQNIIRQLQANLLEAMRTMIPNTIPTDKAEFAFGEFDNGNHWQGVE